jgi:hypothetical protein
MSSHSDVALALKHKAIASLSAETLERLDIFANTQLECEEGKLFHILQVKWYKHDGWVAELYSELEALDNETFRIVEACHDYPANDEGDLGGWDDNPWDICKDVAVSVWVTPHGTS